MSIKLLLELLNIYINILFSSCHYLLKRSLFFIIFKLCLLTFEYWTNRRTTTHINIQRSWCCGIMEITRWLFFCFWLELNFFRYFFCLIRLDIINKCLSIIYTLMHIWWFLGRRKRKIWNSTRYPIAFLNDLWVIQKWSFWIFYSCSF